MARNADLENELVLINLFENFNLNQYESFDNLNKLNSITGFSNEK